MSQVFQADGQQNTSSQTLVNGTPLAVVTSNFLNPPFGTCKAKIIAQVAITLGSIPTSIVVKIFRNPASENVQVGGTGILTAGIAANGLMSVSVQGVDSIPDGRPVQYAVQVTAQGTGTNGSNTTAIVDVTLISG